MRDWWVSNEVTIFVVVIVVVAGLFALLFLQRDRLPEHLAEYKNRIGPDGLTGSAQVRRVLAGLSLVVVVEAPRTAVRAALTDARPAGDWRLEPSGDWLLPDADDPYSIRLRARLVDSPHGSELHVDEAADLAGMPVGDADWRMLVSELLAAVKRAGLAASKRPGSELARVPADEPGEFVWKRS